MSGQKWGLREGLCVAIITERDEGRLIFPLFRRDQVPCAFVCVLHEQKPTNTPAKESHPMTSVCFCCVCHTFSNARVSSAGSALDLTPPGSPLLPFKGWFLVCTTRHTITSSNIYAQAHIHSEPVDYADVSARSPSCSLWPVFCACPTQLT